jgi:invasion protein IalB
MIRLSQLFILALVLVPVTAVAEAPKESSREISKDAPKPSANAPAPVASTPERTTASFGDWVLRCEAAVAAARRVCEVAQVITLQGQTNPTAQVALGKQAPNEGKRLVIVLPPNIAILSKPQVATAKAGPAPIELTWQRCTPGACFASAPMSDDAVAVFTAQTEPGRIVFKDAADREAALPLSFRGLAQALAALAKEQ